MKITLGILLVISVSLNILLTGCHFFNPKGKPITYDGPTLNEEQIKTLMHREKEIYPEICDIIEQYQIFISNIKGKQLIILEENR